MIDGGNWKARDVCGCRYSWIQVFDVSLGLGVPPSFSPAFLRDGSCFPPHSGGPFLGGSLLISYAGVLGLVNLVSLDKFGFFVHPELFTKGRGMDWPGPDCVSTPRPWDRGHPTQTAQAGEECSPSGEQRLWCQKRRDWKPHRWRGEKDADQRDWALRSHVEAGGRHQWDHRVCFLQKLAPASSSEQICTGGAALVHASAVSHPLLPGQLGML